MFMIIAWRDVNKLKYYLPSKFAYLIFLDDVSSPPSSTAVTTALADLAGGLLCPCCLEAIVPEAADKTTTNMINVVRDLILKSE